HCSRRCVGWHAQESLASSLVSRAWEKACLNQPLAPGLLHHSDRGVQYASTQFQTLLHSRGATASMSRKANPYDNALMESFFATLKTECFQNQIPKSRREAKLILFDYIEIFYNRSRLHSALQYQSPLEFENKFNTNNQTKLQSPVHVFKERSCRLAGGPLTFPPLPFRGRGNPLKRARHSPS